MWSIFLYVCIFIQCLDSGHAFAKGWETLVSMSAGRSRSCTIGRRSRLILKAKPNLPDNEYNSGTGEETHNPGTGTAAIGEDFTFENMEHITFVSSNKMKVKEVKLILGTDFPWELKTLSVDLFEPQAPPIEVSRSKCRQAVKICRGPVIVEDTSLCFNALNGLPGPYIKWFYEAIGNNGLAKLVDSYDDRSAYAQCVLTFCLGPGHDLMTFVGSTDGLVVHPSGPQGFGWDPIFKPLGGDRSFAEMTREEKNKVSHRFKAFREFKAFLNKRTTSS